MTTVSDMAVRVRTALMVDAQYEGVTIPAGIRRVMKRLLRDYNFPRSVRRLSVPSVAQGVQSYDVPAGMKRPLEVRFFDPANSTFSSRLERREGYTAPYTDGSAYGSYYWLEGGKLWVDRPMPADDGLTFTLWYQSQLLDAEAETWMLDDIEDIIYGRAIMTLAAELRKTEVASTWAGLVAEEMKSIAVFANELEWSGVEQQMRQPMALPSDRYPTQQAIS